MSLRMANELEERRKGSTTCVDDIVDGSAFVQFRSANDPSRPGTRQKRGWFTRNGKSNEELGGKGGKKKERERERERERASEGQRERERVREREREKEEGRVEGLLRSNLRKVWRQASSEREREREREKERDHLIR